MAIPVEWRAIPRYTLDLPRGLETATYEQLPKSRIKQVTRDYLTRFGEVATQGIAPLFIGRAGTYKTRASAVIARAVFERGNLAVEFVDCTMALLELDMNKYGKGTLGVIERWKRVPFLVMDDFAQVKPTSFGAEIIRGILATRYNALLPTLWTANVALPADEEFDRLGELYGAQFGRRLKERSEGFRVFIE